MDRLVFLNDTRLIKRLVWIALAALLLGMIAFGGYYYWDRYVHLGDKSPVVRNIEHLEKLARENPQDADARLALAQYYLESGMYPEAIDQAQQVSKVYPDNDGALFILGLAYTQTEKPEAAIEPLEKFAETHRKSEMAHIDSGLEAALYFLGENYVKLNRSGEAVDVLTEALGINRTDADAMYQLGLAYAQQGQHDQAVEQFQNAVLFVPDFGDAYSHMVESYSALAKPDFVTYALGMQSYAKQDYSQARQHLETAAQKLPDFLLVHIGLGLTYEQLGDFQLAQKSYERALEIDPNDFTASNALTRIKQRTGEN